MDETLNKCKHEENLTTLYVESKGQTYEVIIDKSDFDKVKKHRWGLNSKKYVITSLDGKQVLLHRLLTEPPKDKYVDHINHNTLDNRKVNLRTCTQSENMMNARLKRNNTSGCPGVYKHSQNDRWIAEIKLNYKHIYLGSFVSKDEAIKSRKEAEVKYFGEYRNKKILEG